MTSVPSPGAAVRAPRSAEWILSWCWTAWVVAMALGAAANIAAVGRIAERACLEAGWTVPWLMRALPFRAASWLVFGIAGLAFACRVGLGVRRATWIVIGLCWMSVATLEALWIGECRQVLLEILG